MRWSDALAKAIRPEVLALRGSEVNIFVGHWPTIANISRLSDYFASVGVSVTGLFGR